MMAQKSGRVMLVGAIGVVVLVLVLLFAGGTGARTPQPLEYNHKVHIENLGLDCVDCHVGVQTSAHASLPPLEVCQNCHLGEPLTESPAEAILINEYVTPAVEIPWARVYTMPDHVYFSHRRHVTGGEIDCRECHGDVGQMVEPVGAPWVDHTMEFCMDCHSERKVMNDCLSCHR